MRRRSREKKAESRRIWHSSVNANCSAMPGRSRRNFEAQVALQPKVQPKPYAVGLILTLARSAELGIVARGLREMANVLNAGASTREREMP